MTPARRLAAEGLGTAMLLAVVVGSGIMAERLAGGNVAIALLANALATGAGLVALILMFGAVSGAHFNPVVTLSEAWLGNLARSALLPYVAAQLAGAFAGVAAAHGMFGEALFTASTSFANPAVTLARAVTSTFAGIRPADAPGFIAAQLLGAALATLLFAWLYHSANSERDKHADPGSRRR